jgi:WD40 repeat protein
LAVGTLGNSTVYIYNVTNSFSLLYSFPVFNSSNIISLYDVDFSPDTTKMIACGDSATLSVWTLNSQNNTATNIFRNQLSNIGTL